MAEGAANRAPKRVYHLTKEEAEIDEALTEGTLLVANFQARVLFDPRATDSFISVKFAELLRPQCEVKSAAALEIHTPLGVSSTYCVFPSVSVVIHQYCMPASLYVSEMKVLM